MRSVQRANAAAARSMTGASASGRRLDRDGDDGAAGAVVGLEQLLAEAVDDDVEGVEAGRRRLAIRAAM